MAKNRMKALETEQEQFVTLYAKYHCENCRLWKMNLCNVNECNNYGMRRREVANAWACNKRFGILKLLLNWGAITIGYYVFQWALYATNWLMLSILAMAATIFVLDNIFIFAGKCTTEFFTKMEERRYHAYEKRIKEIEDKKQQEEEEKAKEAERQNETNGAKEIEEKFKQFASIKLEGVDESTLDSMSYVIQNPFKTDAYKNFLATLHGLCDTLIPECFIRMDVEDIFKIHLPELLKICEKISNRYQELILSPVEYENYMQLIENFTKRLSSLQEALEEQKMPSLNVRMHELNSVVQGQEGGK